MKLLLEKVCTGICICMRKRQMITYRYDSAHFDLGCICQLPGWFLMFSCSQISQYWACHRVAKVRVEHLVNYLLGHGRLREYYEWLGKIGTNFKSQGKVRKF